jgi:DNA-directed RNA polymerase specialized sigma24 family protein
VVAQAAASGMPGSHEALESLCRIYWRPLFLFALRLGHAPEDARDLTQGFFERLIAKSYLTAADPDRGKFRSFLLATFKHFLGHEREKSDAAKRGGGVNWIAMDSEEFQTVEPADDRSPELLFDQTWALSLFEQVLARLRAEFRVSGQEALFDTFKHYLTGDATESYSIVASRIGMTEGAAKMFVSRMRGRYRQLLRSEIGRTVSSAADIDDEIRHLRSIFSRH